MRQYPKIVTGPLAVIVLGLGIGHAEPADVVSRPKWTPAERQRGYAVFRHHVLQPIDDRALLPPSFVPAPEAIVKKVRCEMARGEYESVAVGVHALEEGLKNIRLEVESDLEASIYRGIDSQVRKEFLEYRNSIPAWIHGAFLDESNTIASVGRGRSDIFWVTLHAKPDSAPGLHRGKIRIGSERGGNESTTELDLEVLVRPFVLERARIAYSPFFYVQWGANALPEFAWTDEWLRKLYRDMAEHSHTSVSFHGYPGPKIDLRQTPPPESPYISSLLPMTREVGLTSPEIPCFSWIIALGPPESQGGPSTQQKNRGADWLRNEFPKRGWPELLRYAFDEPGYPSHHSPTLEQELVPFRKVRVRTCTAMEAHSAYGLGDLYDVWIVYAGQISPEMLAEAKRLGSEVWTYSCNLHSCWPLRERYFAGLYVWTYKLKGHTTWHHYAQGPFKHIWMREEDERPMPTVGWETRRDGIDDYRYLQMLEDCIAANPADPLAVDARDWLRSLRKRLLGVDPHLVRPGKPLALEEYDGIRSKAADYIEQLGPVVGEKTGSGVLPAAVAWPGGLKDEGKLFRGKSVEECIGGLKRNDALVRRAAAWALYEMGPGAAPATKALAGQLKDPEVRMPALRALEAIGPKGYPAVPEISRLLSDGDSFVRLGATFALGGIVGSWKAKGKPSGLKTLSPSQLQTIAESLRIAFMDEFHVAARVAGEALARMGPAARPALPEAVELLDRPYRIHIWECPVTVRRVIAAIGSEAGAAVPRLVEIVKEKKGDAPQEIMALAAIGRSATTAVLVLERYAGEGSPQRGRACYALFCIRGEPDDLKNMVNFLKKDERGRAELARYLNALGAQGRPVVNEVRTLLGSQELSKEIREQLESFLEKVQNGEAAVPVLP